MSPQLDFFGIVVSDMARSVAFYRLLGLEFPEGAEDEQHVEAPLPGGMRYALDTEDVVRAFDPDWKRPSDGHSGGGAFRCDSPEEVDQVYRDLLAAGASPHKEPWDAFWGQRYAQLCDRPVRRAAGQLEGWAPSGAERSDKTVDVLAARPPAARRA